VQRCLPALPKVVALTVRHRLQTATPSTTRLKYFASAATWSRSVTRMWLCLRSNLPTLLFPRLSDSSGTEIVRAPRQLDGLGLVISALVGVVLFSVSLPRQLANQPVDGSIRLTNVCGQSIGCRVALRSLVPTAATYPGCFAEAAPARTRRPVCHAVPEPSYARRLHSTFTPVALRRRT
jgi:hypothetical protein